MQQNFGTAYEINLLFPPKEIGKDNNLVHKWQEHLKKYRWDLLNISYAFYIVTLKREKLSDKVGLHGMH